MLFFLNTLYACSSSQQIKHSGTDLFICDQNANNGQNNVLTACTLGEVPTLFKLNTSMDGVHVIESSKVNYVWDIADKIELILYSKHGGGNQLFELRLVANNQFLIINRGWCIEFEPSNKYVYKPCTGIATQLFEFYTPSTGYGISAAPQFQQNSFNYSYQYSHSYPYRTHYSFFM